MSLLSPFPQGQEELGFIVNSLVMIGGLSCEKPYPISL